MMALIADRIGFEAVEALLFHCVVCHMREKDVLSLCVGVFRGHLSAHLQKYKRCEYGGS